MKKLCVVVLFLLLATPLVWADTQDTTVFKAAMSPDNEVPVVSAPGFSGFATITVRVTRDATGNINAATVIFDIDYNLPTATTITGLHIHNALPGTSGGVVINTGLSGTNSLNLSGVGHLTKVVNYASTDTAGLSYVTGLLDMPENYYVNMHSTVQPGGFMRAPCLRTSMTLRPQLSPLQEVPALTGVDAEGAGTILIQVNRNNSGSITSGTVTFDVDYRVPASSAITGLRIQNGAAGATGPISIDTGISTGTRSIASATGRGNIFRIVDIDPSNTAGLATLTALLSDPTPFYLNLSTSSFSSGILRGQFSTTTYAFYGLMTAAEEVPVTTVTATANTMTIVNVTRDVTGNIVSGTVGFNVSYTGFAGPITFTGLHIHNGPIGVAAGVVINTGLSGTNTVLSDTGIGVINKIVTIDSTTAAALTALRGLLANPEMYYVNIHSTVNPGGVIRTQMGHETYHYRALMSSANENPAISPTVTSTGWITVRVTRDPTGVIVGGQVTFDVDTGTTSAQTFTGLHIHTGSATVNGGVVINTGLSGSNSVDAPTGVINITRVVNIGPTDTASLAMLGTLINSPDQAYVNIHTTVNPGGYMRSQMLPVVNYVAQAAGGGDWISSITVTNSSTTASVQGIVDVLQHDGTAMTTDLTDPNISFNIPPGGTTTVNIHNKGTLTTGFARIYSSGPVTVAAAYSYPGSTTTATTTPVTARMVNIPVNVGTVGFVNTGIAVLNVTPGTMILTLRDSLGSIIPGGSASINVTAGQHVVGFVRDLLPDVNQGQFAGRLTIENRPASGTGQMSVLALQFDTALSAVTVTPLP